jgi:hypothetical protein
MGRIDRNAVEALNFSRMRSNIATMTAIQSQRRCTMRPSNLVFMAASAAIAGLSGLAPVNVRAQTSQAGAQSPPQVVEKPYDWNASRASHPN